MNAITGLPALHWNTKRNRLESEICAVVAYDGGPIREAILVQRPGESPVWIEEVHVAVQAWAVPEIPVTDEDVARTAAAVDRVRRMRGRG